MAYVHEPRYVEVYDDKFKILTKEHNLRHGKNEIVMMGEQILGLIEQESLVYDLINVDWVWGSYDEEAEDWTGMVGHVRL